MSYCVNEENNVTTMLKTILPSLPWAVKTRLIDTGHLLQHPMNNVYSSYHLAVLYAFHSSGVQPNDMHHRRTVSFCIHN